MLQEERWRGTPDQTNDLMRRLCAGRSEAVGDCLGRVRDAFEALDGDGHGEVATADVGALFTKAHIGTASLEHTVQAFTARLDKQARDSFSLPDLVEAFGAELQELADASVSVSEAFAMLRMHLPAADVRLAADLALKVRLPPAWGDRTRPASKHRRHVCFYLHAPLLACCCMTSTSGRG